MLLVDLMQHCIHSLIQTYFNACDGSIDSLPRVNTLFRELLSPTLPPVSIPATVKEYSTSWKRPDTISLVAPALVFIVRTSGKHGLVAVMVMICATGRQLVSLFKGGVQVSNADVNESASELAFDGAPGAPVGHGISIMIIFILLL